MVQAKPRRIYNKPIYTQASIADKRKLWASAYSRFISYTSEPAETDPNINEPEDGDDIVIYWPSSYGKTENLFKINLTDLTWSEYVNVRKILAAALRDAAPIIKVRDANAAQKLKNGEVAATRAYRTISRLFDPEGEVR